MTIIELAESILQKHIPDKYGDCSQCFPLTEIHVPYPCEPFLLASAVQESWLVAEVPEHEELNWLPWVLGAAGIGAALFGWVERA
jgi:hypothetical protein